MSLVHENGARTGPARRPEPRGRPAPGSPAALQALQRSAGNAAASAYVQRLAESPGPVTSAAVSPQNDPRFQAVAAKVAGQGRRLRQHPPPRAEARQAADAADPPATDKEAKAKASRADTMSTAKPGSFDKAGFVAAVKKAIAAQAPKNLDEAENFEKSGKAESVKTEVSGKVTDGKKASAQDIAEKTAAAPDTSKVAEKPVTPLRPEPQPAAPRVNTAAAMPAPVPAAQTDLSGDQRETDNAMAEAGITEQQLATSNEPEFTDALAAKKEGEEHSATAPTAFREAEAAQLGAAKQEAQGAGAAGLAGMLATKKGSLSGATAGKTAAKTQEEAERARIATQIKAIFDATKTDVDAILGGLDAKVDQEFSTGEAAIRKAFTADLNARMDAYKDRRYSGAMGKLRWADDLFGDLPKEADQCYVEARVVYEQKMDVLIARVADLIGTQLAAAKDRIAKGRADIKAYVETQPKNLRKIAQQAAGQFASQFDQLENDVDAKKDALVDDLATKYSESNAAVEEEITAMQEENKGLWSRAKAAVGGAIRTITQLKDLLTSALARAAGAIGKIIKDPIGFLGKFVNAVKGGIVRFGENIAQHLKAGLQGWLLGSLSAAGIELPARLDLKGIIGLVLSLLGLTWPAIRARIAKHVPEKVMSGVEKSVAFIQVILSEGVGGLWKWVVEKLGDIKEMVMGQIREFVITKIVKAGITWLISMLNPAAAFIKACKMIYDVVMFFVEKAAQIKEFVDSVLDSVESIAGGGVGAVAGYIEKTLAKMVPVLLGFLAGLLGLGGISEKIKEIIATVQKPVGQVVDKLVAGAVKVGKKLLKKLSGAFQKGKNWVKRKVEQAYDSGRRHKQRGQKLAKGAVTRSEESLNSIKSRLLQFNITKRFATSKESHTISTETGNPERLYVASAKKLLQTLRSAAVKKLNQDYAEQVRKYISATRGLRHPASLDVIKALRAAPKKIHSIAAKIVVALKVHWDNEPPPAELGSVAKHSKQPPNTGKNRLRQTWSEHIIPRALVNYFLIMAKKKILSTDEYNNLTTIKIYKTAAHIKDRGHNADLSLLGQIRGRIKNRIGVGRRGPGNEALERAQRAYSLLSKGSVNRTITAVAADHSLYKDVRTVDGKKEKINPQISQVKDVAEIERVEIEGIFRRKGIR
jgi:hypothetical protein